MCKQHIVKFKMDRHRNSVHRINVETTHTNIVDFHFIARDMLWLENRIGTRHKHMHRHYCVFLLLQEEYIYGLCTVYVLIQDGTFKSKRKSSLNVNCEDVYNQFSFHLFLSIPSFVHQTKKQASKESQAIE